MTDKFKLVYDTRWKQASSSSDTDLLSKSSKYKQAGFFYKHYNAEISSLLEKRLAPCLNKNLIELGCGRGTSGIYQAKNLGMDVVLSDFSDNAISIASSNLTKYSVKGKAICASLYDLPFANDFFDAAISMGVFEHIEHLRTAFNEALRVLKPGGVFIAIVVPEKDSIQDLFSPINRILYLISVRFLAGKFNQPWLDCKTQSKTASVYRNDSGHDIYLNSLHCSGFVDLESYHVNPFPTISSIPPVVEMLIVALYKLVLFARKHILRLKDPFHCHSSLSRCFFIVASKPKF